MSSAVPRVSVYMPVYNGEPFVGEAIASVLGQTLGDLELVIIENGSSDGSRETARAAAGSPTRACGSSSTRARSGSSVPATPGWPRGARRSSRATTRTTSRIRAGFELQVAALEREPGAVAIGTLCEGIDAAGRRVRPRDRWRLVGRSALPPFPHGSACVRRDAFDRVGGYREGTHRWEDVDLFLRLEREGPVLVLPEALYRYRYHVGSLYSVGRERARRGRGAPVALPRGASATGRDWSDLLGTTDGGGEPGRGRPAAGRPATPMACRAGSAGRRSRATRRRRRDASCARGARGSAASPATLRTAARGRAQAARSRGVAARVARRARPVAAELSAPGGGTATSRSRWTRPSRRSCAGSWPRARCRARGPSLRAGRGRALHRARASAAGPCGRRSRRADPTSTAGSSGAGIRRHAHRPRADAGRPAVVGAAGATGPAGAGPRRAVHPVRPRCEAASRMSNGDRTTEGSPASRRSRRARRPDRPGSRSHPFQHDRAPPHDSRRAGALAVLSEPPATARGGGASSRAGGSGGRGRPRPDLALRRITRRTCRGTARATIVADPPPPHRQRRWSRFCAAERGWPDRRRSERTRSSSSRCTGCAPRSASDAHDRCSAGGYPAGPRATGCRRATPPGRRSPRRSGAPPGGRGTRNGAARRTARCARSPGRPRWARRVGPHAGVRGAPISTAGGASRRRARGALDLPAADYAATCDELSDALRGACTWTASRSSADPALGRRQRRPPASDLPDLIVHWSDAACADPVRVAGGASSARPDARRLTGQHAFDGFLVSAERRRTATSSRRTSSATWSRAG